MIRLGLYWCVLGTFAFGFWCAQALAIDDVVAAAVFVAGALVLLGFIAAFLRAIERGAVLRTQSSLLRRASDRSGVMG